MIKTAKKLYDYHCYCDECFVILLFDKEDIIQDEPFDYIICPECGERNYI